MIVSPRCPLALALLAALYCTSPALVNAAENDLCNNPVQHGKHASDDCAAPMDRITVSATLNPRDLSQVASDVSVITREDMDRHLVTNLRDLVRYLPGVTVTSTPGRFGQSGFSIRGLGGNRVRMEIDGVPVADTFSFGSMLSAGRNMVDLDSIKRVEILRGPASSLYGSDALGGVVSYVTKDPVDYLRNGEDHHVAVKGQYDSANRGSAGTITWATGDARNGFMVLATHREAHQTNNMGDVGSMDGRRTRPDPRTSHSNNILAKYVHGADGDSVSRITLDARRSEGHTQLWSALDERTPSMRAHDRARRDRLSFEQNWSNLGSVVADRINATAWYQRSEVEQRSIEVRMTGPGYERHVKESFGQRVAGVQVHAFKHLQTGNVAHDITWGLDWSRTHTEELRDGFAINLSDGSTSTTTDGGNADNYPSRDFAPAYSTNAALFIQDEMILADGRLRVIPGLRFDHYHFEPQDDALFESQPLSEHVDSQTDQHLSPKLGVVWQLGPHYNVYAQYASGFRAPPYSDLGMLFSNLAHGYAAIPNPELKPETSRSIELGLRGEGQAGRFSLVAYNNHYEDFIASQHMISRDQWPDWASQTPGLFLIFQSVNLNQARVRGVEASGTLYLDTFSDALQGWSLHASLSKSRGDSREEGEQWVPLNSVDPARAVIGVSWQGLDWGLELMTTAVDRKDRLTDEAIFRAPGYATVDLYAHWSPLPDLKLYAGLTNLGNRKYWNWGALHGGAIGSTTETSAVIDRYTATGRSISVAARWDF